MREIKWRVWDKEKGQFFKPIYEAYKRILEELALSQKGDLLLRHFVENYPGPITSHESVLDGRFDKPQFFTGLKDKNGREIFEGDILGAPDEMPLYVEYSEERGAFCFVDKFDPYGIEHYTAKNISYEAFEVIGNIYEHSHLLEGK